MNTKPTFQSSSGSTYWQPRFDPSTAVTDEWDAKQGNNNGWGNAELEHYTALPANSFFTPDHKLVLRAISQPNHADAAQKYTSARLVSRQTLGRDRGSLIGVLSLPCAGGIWPAFWLLPREPFSWPSDGEIDIAETWNSDHNNKSCVHWGFFNGEDSQKHRTMGTDIPDMHARPVHYEFAWDSPAPGQGRTVFWIDGRPVMKADIPAGTRPIRDFQIILNVAMGGNVCAGQLPAEGQYDLVVHDLRMLQEPENGGWDKFEAGWRSAPLGNTM